MKINDLIADFRIQMSNEECAIYEKVEGIMPIAQFSERERFIIENLVRKSLITKISKATGTWVVKNEQSENFI